MSRCAACWCPDAVPFELGGVDEACGRWLDVQELHSEGADGFMARLAHDDLEDDFDRIVGVCEDFAAGDLAVGEACEALMVLAELVKVDQRRYECRMAEAALELE